MTNRKWFYFLMAAIVAGCAAPDTTPPTITDVQLVDDLGNPVTSVTISDVSDIIVYCSVVVSDAETGVADASCALHSPSGIHDTSCILSDVSQVVGDSSSGTWKCPMTLTDGYEAGSWTLSVAARDGVLNRARHVAGAYPPDAGLWDTGLDVTYGAGCVPDTCLDL